MTWKNLLVKLLDAAETAFPQFKFLLEFLRPYLTAAAPDGMVVMGAGEGPPSDLVTMVQDFLTGLLAKTTRPLVKVGLRVLVSLTPYLLGLIWTELFPNQPATFAATAPPDFGAVLAAADVE